MATKQIDTRNYNAGKVLVKCKIYSYCPFEKTVYTDNSIVLNSETVQGLPSSVVSQIEYVQGENGLFLRENLYNYHSQWLFIRDEQVCPSCSNLTSVDTSEMEHYSWDVTNNIFSEDGSIIPKFSEYLGLGSNSKTDKVRWDLQNERVTLEDGNKEMSTGDVLMPVAASANAEKTKGIHWRVKKRTSLFRGEDFYVEFRRTSTAIDTSNIKSTIFQNYSPDGDDSAGIYRTIDSRDDIEFDGKPISGGVVEYDSEISDGFISYIPIDKSREVYDLNNQAYFVIEMGVGLNYRYFILVTQKGRPRFIKVINDNGTYRSFVVSEYNKINGSFLFNDLFFRVSVRNHLGKIVVMFNDLDPWVIEDAPAEKQAQGEMFGGAEYSVVGDLFQADEEAAASDTQAKLDMLPPALFVVPSAPIAIWGGNISMGFLFSPITYNSEATITLPGSTKQTTSSTGEIDVPSFVLPVPAYISVLLSQRDMGLDSSATPRAGSSFQISGLVRGDKKPFYTCDCQQTEEIVDYTSKINNEPYFMDYGDFIKSLDFTAEKYGLSKVSVILKETPDESQPDDQNSLAFYVELKMKAGSHIFDNGWLLEQCKTPIATIIRLVSEPTQNDAWPTKEIDASDLIMSYNESWSSSDFSKMEHTGTIRFLVNKGQKNDDLRKSVEALRDKAFYIKVEAGYDGCNYPRLDGLKRMITGISYGGIISEKAGERIMECKIYDYTKVLEQALIFNSPFFDGVRDINAIYELSKFVGFKEDTIKISVDTINGKLQTDVDADPSFLLARSVQTTKDKDEYGGGDGLQSPDGRKVTKTKVYALPHGYNILQGGAEFKFNDGDTVASAMDKICKRSGKVLFFDSYGMLHYESFPIASVLYNPSTGASQAGDLVPSQWNFSVSPLAATNGTMLLHTQLTRELAVEDVYNNIFVVTSTPRQELIFADDINKKSINDPTTEGFLGYRKTFFQMDGIFGSAEASNNYMKHLKKFYRPPVVYKFETFGVPMRCFDIVNVDGQKMIVVSVSQNIDAKDNKWWMNVEGEWYFGDTGLSLT